MNAFRALAVASAVALAGCNAHTSARMTDLSTIEMGPDRGAVLFTMENDYNAKDTPFTLRIRRYDPGTGRFAASSGSDGEGTTDMAVATYGPRPGRTDKHWAYALRPGHYAIESIEAGQPKSKTGYRGSGDPVAGLALTLSVLAVKAVAAQIDQNQISFSDGYQLVADAPRFEIQAGRVSYIGGFRFSSESKLVTVYPSGDGSPNTSGDLEPREVEDRRFILDYVFDTDDTERHTRLRGITGGEILHHRLTVLEAARFVVKDFETAAPASRTLPHAPPS